MSNTRLACNQLVVGKSRTRCLQDAPRCSKRPTRRPKKPRRGPRDAPKTFPRRPKTSPRRFQDASRTAPERLQEGSSSEVPKKTDVICSSYKFYPPLADMLYATTLRMKLFIVKHQYQKHPLHHNFLPKQ